MLGSALNCWSCSARVGWGILGHKKRSTNRQEAAKDEWHRQIFQTTLRRMNEHGRDGVDHRGASKDDGHHRSCRGTFINGGCCAKREDKRQGTQGTGDTGNKAPGNTELVNPKLEPRTLRTTAAMTPINA